MQTNCKRSNGKDNEKNVCHLLYRVRSEQSCNDTNLQVPVDDPINMAVMDTLQDLLYAVAEGRKGEERAQG